MNSNNKASTCLWRGHKDEGCDATAVEGRSYCEQHLWRVYSRGTAVRPRPRKDRQQQSAEEFMQQLRDIFEELEGELR